MTQKRASVIDMCVKSLHRHIHEMRRPCPGTPHDPGIETPFEHDRRLKEGQKSPLTAVLSSDTVSLSWSTENTRRCSRDTYMYLHVCVLINYSMVVYPPNFTPK